LLLTYVGGRFAAARASAGEHDRTSPVTADAALQLRHRARREGEEVDTRQHTRQHQAAQCRADHQRRRHQRG